MRRSGSAVVAVALVTLGAVATASPAGATTGALTTQALWNMNEPGGSTVLVDDSGNGFTGTIGAHVIVGSGVHTFPYHNGAAGGSADPAHLDVIKNTLLNPGVRDYAVTVRFRSTTDIGTVVQSGQSDTHGMVKVELDHKAGHIVCQFVGSLGSAGVATPLAYNDNQFHTVTCLRTSTNVTVTVDGTQVAQNPRVAGNIAPVLPFAIGGKYACNPNATIPVDCDTSPEPSTTSRSRRPNRMTFGPPAMINPNK